MTTFSKMINVLFVFDTNALISAHLIRKSVSAEALDKALNIGNLTFSDNTLTEFTEVLYRSKLDRYFTSGERDEILATLTFKSVRFIPTANIKASRDSSDDMFLELAVTAEAACLISGDPDLLVLHPFRGIPIMNATDFLQNF